MQPQVADDRQSAAISHGLTTAGWRGARAGRSEELQPQLPCPPQPCATRQTKLTWALAPAAAAAAAQRPAGQPTNQRLRRRTKQQPPATTTANTRRQQPAALTSPCFHHDPAQTAPTPKINHQPSPHLSKTDTSLTMSDAALRPERDFSKEADKQIPEAEKLAKVRPCPAAHVGTYLAHLRNRQTSMPPSRSSQLSKSRHAR